MRRSSRLGLLVVVLAVSTACGGRTRLPQPFPTAGRPPVAPASPVAPDPAASAEVRPVLETALGLLGVPYRNGGSDPRGFDCSGFVAYVFGQHGMRLPRSVGSQATVGRDVPRPEPGDLVFFATSGRGPTHVGIALGPDRFIHAPSSRGVVRVELMGAEYWARRFIEARRVVGP